MKVSQIYILAAFTGLIMFSSCEDYLDKTPYADVTDEDIFDTYESFQGFVDVCYSEVLNYNSFVIGNNLDAGGDIISNNRVGVWGNDGNYWAWTKSGSQGFFHNDTPGNRRGFGPNDLKPTGYWFNSWRGIRQANLALEKLPLLSKATEEEKSLIKGQALFFRAFFHWEIIRAYGGMPYSDRIYSPNETLNFPRLSYQESTDLIARDFELAAELLPEDWDKTVVGSKRPGANTGRATKGAALAFKAKALLFAGSPMMNGFSGNSFTYNKTYMEKAAETAWELIELANKGVYALVPFSEYRNMFGTKDRTVPWTSENIFQKHPNPGSNVNDNNFSSGALDGRHGRTYNPARFGGNAICQAPNQLYIDRFEMADGTRYKPEYDNDDEKRWENRDPRLRQNVIVDRDQWGFHPSTVFHMYMGGIDKGSIAGMFTPYCIKKYWPIGVNSYDKEHLNFVFVQPHIRLAEVFLIYAEAVNEAYGPDGSVPGAGLTAVDALNIVRRRAGMPDVTAAATGYSSFRELVWNERSVELCFEGHFWFDIRRWFVGHLPEYLDIVDLEFDKDWTYFNRVVIKKRVFENPKHYWLPLPREQTLIYKEFYQNPGW